MGDLRLSRQCHQSEVPHGSPWSPHVSDIAPAKSSRLTPYSLLLSGLLLVAAIDLYSAVMARQFQDTDNAVGKGFAVRWGYSYYRPSASQI